MTDFKPAADALQADAKVWTGERIARLKTCLKEAQDLVQEMRDAGIVVDIYWPTAFLSPITAIRVKTELRLPL